MVDNQCVGAVISRKNAPFLREMGGWPVPEPDAEPVPELVAEPVAELVEVVEGPGKERRGREGQPDCNFVGRSWWKCVDNSLSLNAVRK